MAEAKNYVFDYKEIAEILIKAQGIHEGLWGIYIEFGFGAANIQAGPSQDMVLPAAIIPVKSIGIQRFDEPNSLTVDAAEVNPLLSGSEPPASGKKTQSRRRRTR
jgi:hypothetical protein